MTAVRVRTSTGWQDIAIQGGPGVAGPVGPAGPQGPSGAPSPADRWARIVRTANAAAGNDYTVTGTTLVAIDSTNLRITKTCSGTRPVRCHLRGMAAQNTAGGLITFSFRMDGAVVDGGIAFNMISATVGQQIPLNLAWDWVPSAGSHYFEPWWNTAASGIATLYARAGIPMQFTWEELPYG
jgi:hypothetical protein